MTVGVVVAVGVTVGVFVGVEVMVGVLVGVEVTVGVLVGVPVLVGVLVRVGVIVGVFVGVEVMVGVLVRVGVAVAVGATVGVLVAVGVAVTVGVLVRVAVAVGVGVGGVLLNWMTNQAALAATEPVICRAAVSVVLLVSAVVNMPGPIWSSVVKAWLPPQRPPAVESRATDLVVSTAVSVAVREVCPGVNARLPDWTVVPSLNWTTSQA